MKATTLNHSRLGVVCLNHVRLNSVGLPGRGKGGSSVGDTYILNGALLSESGLPLLLEDGTPLVLETVAPSS